MENASRRAVAPVRGAFGRLGHVPGIEILDHQGASLIRQCRAEVVRVIGTDARWLTLELAELTPQPGQQGASALAGQVPLLAPDFGPQLALICQAVDLARAV